MLKQNRRGALELSIGTIVILVIGMSMLILGLTLVRTIFKSGTESVNALDESVKKEINKLFSDEGKDVVVMLGSDRTAKIKPDTQGFGIGILSRTPDGTSATRERLNYKLTLGEGNCRTLLTDAGIGALFVTSLNTMHTFDEIYGSNVAAFVTLNVPKGTPVCSQKVNVDVIDTTTNLPVGGSFFRIEIVKSGFFG